VTALRVWLAVAFLYGVGCSRDLPPGWLYVTGVTSAEAIVAWTGNDIAGVRCETIPILLGRYRRVACPADKTACRQHVCRRGRVILLNFRCRSSAFHAEIKLVRGQPGG